MRPGAGARGEHAERVGRLSQPGEGPVVSVTAEPRRSHYHIWAVQVFVRCQPSSWRRQRALTSEKAP
jgi:hypothetical protein